MKIAITGHTKGIGLATKNLLEKDYDVIGFSLSNGYNIRDYEKIINEVSDCDVFINNAYYENYQNILAEKLFYLWKKQNKLIINIGTVQIEFEKADNKYRINKSLLKKFSKDLQTHTKDKICRVVLISPGATDTPLTKDKDFFKMDPNEVAKAIKFSIQNKYIKEIMLFGNI